MRKRSKLDQLSSQSTENTHDTVVDKSASRLTNPKLCPL